jgi:uncharacterized NAD(P)/FAD-binding protein YdhS
MSLDPERPLDFAAWWAAEQGAAIDAVSALFAPRDTFGRYVEARFAEVAHAIARVFARVVALERVDGVLRATLDDGASIDARRVVLAIGNGAPAWPAALAEAARRGRVVDPLVPSALDGLARDADVLVLGTGLTAIDALARLDALGHTGAITCVSRHGRWPLAHRASTGGASVVSIDPHALAASPRAALRHVRHAIDAVVAAGGELRAVIDALRPHTAPTWRAWDEGSRAQALRHLRALWDVHRHRAPPEVAAAHAAFVRRAGVETCAARIAAAIVRDDGRVEVSLRRRGARAIEVRVVDAIVLALGPTIALAARDDALPRALLARGLTADDALGLGPRVDDEGRVLDADGRPAPELFALGPLLRGRDWEATAVPELRVQAAALAARLAG